MSSPPFPVPVYTQQAPAQVSSCLGGKNWVPGGRRSRGWIWWAGDPRVQPPQFQKADQRGQGPRAWAPDCSSSFQLRPAPPSKPLPELKPKQVRGPGHLAMQETPLAMPASFPLGQTPSCPETQTPQVWVGRSPASPTTCRATCRSHGPVLVGSSLLGLLPAHLGPGPRPPPARGCLHCFWQTGKEGRAGLPQPAAPPGAGSAPRHPVGAPGVHMTVTGDVDPCRFLPVALGLGAGPYHAHLPLPAPQGRQHPLRCDSYYFLNNPYPSPCSDLGCDSHLMDILCCFP